MAERTEAEQRSSKKTPGRAQQEIEHLVELFTTMSAKLDADYIQALEAGTASDFEMLNAGDARVALERLQGVAAFIASRGYLITPFDRSSAEPDAAQALQGPTQREVAPPAANSADNT